MKAMTIHYWYHRYTCHSPFVNQTSDNGKLYNDVQYRVHVYNCYSPPAYYILNKGSVTFVSDQGHVYNEDHI